MVGFPVVECPWMEVCMVGFPVVECPWMEVSLGHVVGCALGCPLVELAFPGVEETGKG